MAHSKLITLLALITLPITGCFEIDYISIEVDKDLTSSLEFIVSESKEKDPNVDPDQEELTLGRLRECGFSVTNVAQEQQHQKFLVSQYFATITELQEGIQCGVEEQFLSIDINYQKDIWDEFYQLTLKTPNFTASEWEKRKNDLAQANKIGWFKINNIRISLPGEIDASENFGTEVAFKKSIKERTVAWNFDNQEQLADPYWWISHPLNIEAKSTYHNLELKWKIKAAIISTGLVLTVILGFYFLRTRPQY